MAKVLRRQEDRPPLVFIPNPAPLLARGKRRKRCRGNGGEESALGFLATSHSPARRGGSLATILLLQAFFAVAPDFRARYGHLHVEVARNLLLQLFVQAALAFADLAPSQGCHIDVIPRPLRFGIC